MNLEQLLGYDVFDIENRGVSVPLQPLPGIISLVDFFFSF